MNCLCVYFLCETLCFFVTTYSTMPGWLVMFNSMRLFHVIVSYCAWKNLRLAFLTLQKRTLDWKVESKLKLNPGADISWIASMWCWIAFALVMVILQAWNFSSWCVAYELHSYVYWDCNCLCFWFHNINIHCFAKFFHVDIQLNSTHKSFAP